MVGKLIKLGKLLKSLDLQDYSVQVMALSKIAIPIRDVDIFETDDLSYLDPKTPGIGYDLEPEERVKLKELMKNTEDDYVIISPDNISTSLINLIHSDNFKEFLAKKNYPENYKILLVGSKSFSGDYKTGDWIAHDLFGHPIEAVEFPEASDDMYRSRYIRLRDNTLMEKMLAEGVFYEPVIDILIQRLHQKIPSETGINESMNRDDKFPDILVSIFNKSFTKASAISTIPSVIDDFIEEYIPKDDEWRYEDSFSRIGFNNIEDDAVAAEFKNALSKELRNIIDDIFAGVISYAENLGSSKENLFGNSFEVYHRAGKNKVIILRTW